MFTPCKFVMAEKNGGIDGNKEESMSGVMAAIAKMRQEMQVTPEANKGRAGEANETNKRQKVDLPPRIEKPRITSVLPSELPPRVPKPIIDSATKDNKVSTPVTDSSHLPLPPKKNILAVDNIRRKISPSSSSDYNLHTFSRIQVARSQTGNPILEYLPFYQTNTKIRDVDYVINSKCVALFLSLKYHKLHPEYIYNKLKKVTYNHEDTIRVLLVLVDISDFQDVIRELNKIALYNKLSLIVAWSNEQCATYLQNLKSVEKETSKKIIQGSRSKDEEVLANDTNYLERVIDVISSVKSVSQTNAKSLIAKHGSVRAVIAASPDDLSAIDGLGPLKVDRLMRAFNDPFLGGGQSS